MFRLGQKVKVVRGTYAGKRGVITHVGPDSGYVSIMTNKGIHLSFVFENLVQPR